MKKALVLALILLMGLTAFNGVVLAGGGGIPDGAVMQKQFPIQNLPTPKVIQYFNKVIDMGNNLKGEMLIGKDEQAFFEVWKPNSGKRDVYVWNGTSWEYKYSITHIVPGFEKPATLNTYKYANWREYTNHKVQMDDGNTPTPPPNNSLTVTLTGPDKLSVNEQGTYTAHISGGVSPFTLTWSSDGYVSQSGVNAYYKWSKTGTYTVTVLVRDGAGNTASASLDVEVVSPYDFTLTPPNMLLFLEGRDGARTTGTLFKIYVTDLTKTLKSVEVTSIKINGQDWTRYFGYQPSPAYKHPWGRKVLLNNGIGSAVFGLGKYNLWPAGIPLGNDNVEVTVKFGDKYITKSVTVPIKLGRSFDSHIIARKYSTGTTRRNTYHYFVSYTTHKVTGTGADGKPITQTFVYVKEVTSNKYHPTVEGVLNDSKVQKALSELQSNPNSADSVGSAKGTDINAWVNATNKAISGVGAQQKTSDRTIVMQNGKSTGILADSDRKTVHPYTTSRTVNVKFSYTREIITRDWTLNSYIRKRDYYHTYERTAEEDPRLLELVTPVKLPSHLYHAWHDTIAIMEPGDYAEYEVSPTTAKGDLLLSDLYSGPWKWDNINKKWIVRINLNQPNTLPYVPIHADLSAGFYIEYKDNGDKIGGITSSKSSIDIKTVQDGVASDEATIWYVLSSGKYINPKGSVAKEVKDSSGNLIAYAILNKFALRVIGIKKGQGTLTLTKDDLQGPFGISLPVTVEAVSQDAKNINFTINGKNYGSVGSKHWLGGYKWDNNSSKGYYRMWVTRYGTWKHAKYYFKQYYEYYTFVYDRGFYTLNIKNTGDTKIILKISYDDIAFNGFAKRKTYTYAIYPGEKLNRFPPIRKMAHDWYYWSDDRDDWTGLIRYEVDAKIGDVYVPIKKGADAVTFSTAP